MGKEYLGMKFQQDGGERRKTSEALLYSWRVRLAGMSRGRSVVVDGGWMGRQG